MAARNEDNARVQEDGGRIYRIDRNLAETYDNFIDLARDRGMIEDGVKTVVCFSPTVFDEQPPPAPPSYDTFRELGCQVIPDLTIFVEQKDIQDVPTQVLSISEGHHAVIHEEDGTIVHAVMSDVGVMLLVNPE